MSILNKVMMIGNLTADPVVRETGKGTPWASFSVALNHRANRRDGEGAVEEVTYVDVVVWERMAENASQYLKKGSGVLIEGRLQQDRWEDKETGKKRSRLQVVGERMRFLSGGDKSGDRSRPSRQNADERSSSTSRTPPRRREYASARE